MRTLQFKSEVRDVEDVTAADEVFGHSVKHLSSKVTHEAAKQMTSGTGTIATVVVDDLRPTQDLIHTDKIQGLASNWEIASQRLIDVILNPMTGKLYVWGGHHHVAAAKQNGIKTLTAVVYTAHSVDMFADED